MLQTKYKYQADKDDREWVKENLLNNARVVFLPPSRFDTFDIYYLPKQKLDKNGNDINNKMRFLEIKTRNFEHDKYDTTFVELDKFEAITSTTVNSRIPTELIVLFEDGYLYYSPENVIKLKDKISKKYCPDQYDAYGDKWCNKMKDVVELKITDEIFHTYETSRKDSQPENS